MLGACPEKPDVSFSGQGLIRKVRSYNTSCGAPINLLAVLGVASGRAQSNDRTPDNNPRQNGLCRRINRLKGL
jgi:hypothetical protein